MAPVIKVENLGKKYIIGHQRQERYVALRDVITEKFKSWGTKKSCATKEDFWALNDVSFEIKQGERVGVIGRNGAGKSTLLKLLSRITEPTTGRIAIKGRVVSLLEVGTGFHPELTGRENIYLNGAILGMKHSEIKKKFDEIVAFSEVEKFLDTPVKRYSSGMYVRLAFAVAAHLESEILVVDEVLAVGDAQFQKKCLGKMEDVGKDGRTVLFVSHNMGAVTNLCNRCIFLSQGIKKLDGNVQMVVPLYLDAGVQGANIGWSGIAGDENVNVLKTWVRPRLSLEGGFDTSGDIEIGLEVEILKPLVGLVLGFTLFSSYGGELAYVLFDDDESEVISIPTGRMEKCFVIPGNTLAHGDYEVEFDVGIHMVKRIITDEGRLRFHLDNTCGLGRKYSLPDAKGKNSIFRPLWRI